MRGTYRFYQDGELIASHKNLLTTEGKRLILRYLAGQAPSLGGAIGLGVSATPATVDDFRLGFEVDRAVVDLRSADYANNVVLFKGTLPQEAEYIIYEAGLWSATSNVLAGNFASENITSFELGVEEWTNAMVDTSHNRTTEDAVRIDVTGGSSTSSRIDVDVDYSGYTANDDFLLAFYKPDNGVDTITLIFEDVLTGGTLTNAVTVSSLPVGYNIISFRKGDFIATGTIDWGTITRMGFDVAATTTSYVVLDSLRVEDTDTPNQEYILVSRSVLGTPIVKTSVSPMDVEYALEFNVT